MTGGGDYTPQLHSSNYNVSELNLKWCMSHAMMLSLVPFHEKDMVRIMGRCTWNQILASV